MEDWHELGNEIAVWLKEYADSNRITALVVGVSGGIDSAVTSALCAKTGLKTIVLNMPIHQETSQYDLSNQHI
ncbi:MAG: NAD(+) synthase, partial [Candidatus Poseidoniia archaeon]